MINRANQLPGTPKGFNRKERMMLHSIPSDWNVNEKRAGMKSKEIMAQRATKRYDQTGFSISMDRRLEELA